MKTSKAFPALVGALALSASAGAFAQASSDGYSWIPMTTQGYVGGAVGQSSFDLNCSPGFSCDDEKTGFKIFTGGKFNENFGVELSYINMGQADANGGETKAQGADLSLVGSIPFGQQFSVFGKVGGTLGFTRVGASAPGAQTGDEHGFNLSYGAGLQYAFNRNWALTGEWNHYRFDYIDRDDDVQLVSLGLKYMF